MLAVVWGATFDHYFSASNPADAFNVGQVLANRYSQDDVIWIVSGEYQKIAWESVARDREVPSAAEIELIRQLALGLESVHQGRQLMTVRSDAGSSSSGQFHDEPWLDFNTVQTFDIANSMENLVAGDWRRSPAKPTINSEPTYEGRDLGFRNDPITAFKVRYEAYHSVLQGAFGHTYGHMDVWQATPGWLAALDAEGASHMQHLRRLFESRPMYVALEPVRDAAVGAGESYQGLSSFRVARAADGSYALVYFPGSNLSKTINFDLISSSLVNAWWYNPRDGQTYNAAGEVSSAPFARFNTSGLRSYLFVAPGFGAEEDWVLVLDDASRDFLPPGTVPEPPLNGEPPPVEEPPTDPVPLPEEPTVEPPSAEEPPAEEPPPVEEPPADPIPSPEEPTDDEVTPQEPDRTVLISRLRERFWTDRIRERDWLGWFWNPERVALWSFSGDGSSRNDSDDD